MESDIVCEGYLTKAPPLDQPRSVSYFIVYCPFISTTYFLLLSDCQILLLVFIVLLNFFCFIVPVPVIYY